MLCFLCTIFLVLAHCFKLPLINNVVGLLLSLYHLDVELCKKYIYIFSFLTLPAIRIAITKSCPLTILFNCKIVKHFIVKRQGN